MMFFKKKDKLERQIDFNVDEMRKKLDRVSPVVYDNRNTTCFKAMREAIETAKNIKTVTVHKIGINEDVQRHFYMTKGAIACLDDLLGMFDQMITNEELKRKTSTEKGTRSMVKPQAAAPAADY